MQIGEKTAASAAVHTQALRDIREIQVLCTVFRDVVIVRKQETADSGDVVVALVNGDSATIKKLKRHQNGITLMPTNPTYEPMYYSNEEIMELPVNILGKVVELRAKF